MSQLHFLMALALVAGACGTRSATSHDAGAGQTAGVDGGASGQMGAAGAAGGRSGAGGQSGANDGQGGTGGGFVDTVAACIVVDDVSQVTSPCSLTCGNGAIDSCSYRTLCSGSGTVCPTATLTETCDGDALGTGTCTSLGFTGGTLKCAPWCGFDTRGCDACAHGPGIAGCVSAGPEAGTATLLALATTDTEIGIAWLDDESSTPRTGVRFARFRPDLTRLSWTGCIGPDAPTQVALAATPSGWLIAVTSYDGLHVFPLSATGTPSGKERVIPAGQDPLFVSQPAAGPLLYWTQPGQTMAAILAADGSEQTTPVQVFPSFAIGATAGVFTGDGFLLASQLAQIVTTLIGTDGHKTVQQTITSSLQPTGYVPSIAWNGTSGAISYLCTDPETSASGLAWLPIDGTGATTGPAGAVVGASPLQGSSLSDSGAPIALVGNQALVLFGPTQTDLEVLKLDAAGSAVGAPFALTHDPALMRAYVLGKRGTEVIAAWTTNGSVHSTNDFPGRIGLARFAP